MVIDALCSLQHCKKLKDYKKGHQTKNFQFDPVFTEINYVFSGESSRIPRGEVLSTLALYHTYRDARRKLRVPFNLHRFIVRLKD